MSPIEFYPVPDEIRKGKKLSLLMPFLNEEKAIVKNVHEVIRVLLELDFNFEIVLIDDGSKDSSYELLTQEFQNNPFIILTKNFQNFGKGWALKTGYEFCTGDYILFLDSDLELSPYHIPNFFKTMLDHSADAVIGSKLHPDSIIDYPVKRRIVSFIYYSIIKLLFGLPIMDSQTGIKLFQRGALEGSLPKVLVKKFAFDIELLIILHKNHKKIVSAPIELNFSRGSFGNIRFKTMVNTFMDTLAVFYRDKILHFYGRPLAQNEKFFYSIVLFPEKYDDYEKKALQRFLDIYYENFEVILIGKNNLETAHPLLSFEYSNQDSFMERLKVVLEKKRIHGEIVVFSKLNAYPDKRFLFHTGRILALPDVAGAGGYLLLQNQANDFENISNSVITSFFLNWNMIYRFRPMNFQNVVELQMDGLFVYRKYLEEIDFKACQGLKLEYVLSRLARKNKSKLVYSPDIMLYKKFPDSPPALINHIKKEAIFRASQFKSHAFKSLLSLNDLKFFLSLVLLVFIPACAGLAIAYQNFYFLLPLIIYYFLMLMNRLYFFGFKIGLKSFFYLAIAQIIYGFYFCINLFATFTASTASTE
jgi:glycosyltransferase involved in cell wall biosynthesis